MKNDTHRIITYYISTVKSTRVSDQYCFNFYLREMEQIRYIICYSLLKYDDNIFLVMLFIEMSWLILFTTIKWLFSWYFLSQFFKAVKELHKLWFFIWSKEIFKGIKFLLTKRSEYQKTEQYQGSSDRGELDIKSDVNIPDSGKLQKSTTESSQCEKLS